MGRSHRQPFAVNVAFVKKRRISRTLTAWSPKYKMLRRAWMSAFENANLRLHQERERFQMLYSDLADEFEVDGSLRDIYVLNTSALEGNRWRNLTPDLGGFAYSRDGKKAPLPTDVSLIFEDADHSHLLRFNLGGPTINTHFFVEDEIEFDFDPREITSQSDLDLVLNFCASIAQNIERDIRITPENVSDVIYLLYSVEQETWLRPMTQ